MLEGILIVDLTSVVFGPYATQILADLGAEVLKIEPPQGDQFRYSWSEHPPGFAPTIGQHTLHAKEFLPSNSNKNELGRP
jgi:crotonobetainyl-CoA:carnitine CoA-transferase CaiB-like acyl-CoA transferase